MSEADVVVVGAGHNGLVCAAYLARAGLGVTVLEARGEVGGTAGTMSALSARVNVCNCEHTFIRATPILEELGLAGHGLRYLDVDPVMLNMMWDHSPAWMIFHDVERTLESIALARGPRHAQEYRRHLAEALPLARLVLEAARHVPSFGSLVRAAGRRRGRGLLPALRWMRSSVVDVLRSTFTDEGMIAPCIVAGPVTWGLSPETPGSGYGALLYALKHAVPAGRPEGGSGALPRALQASVEAQGGRVRCNARVERIIVEGGRVRGVTLDGGEEVRAATVVAACEPRRVFVSWLGDPPAEVRALAASWRRRPQLEGYESKVDAVIASPPRYRSVRPDHLERLGVADPSVPTAIVAKPVAEIVAAHELMTRGIIADRLMHFVNVPTVLDPSMGPTEGERRHVFSLESIYTPYGLQGGWEGSAEPARWLQAFEDLVEPGFLAGMGDWQAVTPPVYEREFGCPRGVPPAWGGTPLDALVGRDRELTRYETPMPGLFLSGAGTFPGAGVWGAAGRNTAAVVLARRDRRSRRTGLA